MEKFNWLNISPTKVNKKDYQQKTHRTIFAEKRSEPISSRLMLLVFDPTHEQILIDKDFAFGLNTYIYRNVFGEVLDRETIPQATSRILKHRTGLSPTKILNSFVSGISVPDHKQTIICVCEATGVIKSQNPSYVHQSNWYTKKGVQEILSQKEVRIESNTHSVLCSWVYC